MKYPLSAISSVIETLLRTDARQSTKYLSDKDVIRASRVVYTNRKNGKKSFNVYKNEIVLTMGKPNFAEREFIKKCKKAGEKFPVRKIQLKFLS